MAIKAENWNETQKLEILAHNQVEDKSNLWNAVETQNRLREKSRKFSKAPSSTELIRKWREIRC